MKARIAKEVVVRMPHELGSLGTLAKLVAEKGINILAITTYTEGREDVVRMITDDNLRVMDAFGGRGFGPKEHEVVVSEMEHRPGMLMRLAEDLAVERIDLTHLYATASGDQPKCYFVFSTNNNARAVVVLKG